MGKRTVKIQCCSGYFIVLPEPQQNWCVCLQIGKTAITYILNIPICTIIVYVCLIDQAPEHCRPSLPEQSSREGMYVQVLEQIIPMRFFHFC